MNGDINRDWKNVDWHWCSTEFGKKITISATVNGREIRSYELDAGISFKTARLIDDMFTALKQHKGQL